jgi:hypothetical protein
MEYYHVTAATFVVHKWLKTAPKGAENSIHCPRT